MSKTIQATEAEAKKVADLLGSMFNQDPPKVMFNTWRKGSTMVVTEELPWDWHIYADTNGFNSNLPPGVWVEQEPYDNSIASIWKEI